MSAADHGATMRCLREAAIEFAAAVEAEDDDGVRRTWDGLRKAAIRYALKPRPEGRPRLEGA